MIKQLWFLLIGLIWVATPVCFVQGANIDSLRTLYYQQPDSLKPSLADDLSDGFEELKQWDSVLKYNEVGLELAYRYHDTTSIVELTYNYFPYYLSKGDTAASDSVKRKAYALLGHYGSKLVTEFTQFNNSIISATKRYSLLILQDSSNALGLDSVISLYKKGKFKPNFKLKPVPDITSWIRFRVKAYPDSSTRALFMLGMESHSWDSAWIYFPLGPNKWREEKTGLKVYQKDKNGIKDWRNMFYVDLPAGSDTTLFIKVKGFTTLRFVPDYYLSQLPSHYLIETKVREDKNIFAFVGILLAMGMYFLLLAMVTKEKSYWPYLLYLFGVILLALNHLKYHDWFPLMADYEWVALFLGLAIAGIGLLSFARVYLNMKDLAPLWDKITRIFTIIFIIPPTYISVLFASGIFFGNRLLPTEWEDFLNASAQIMVIALFIQIFLGLLITVVLGIIAFRKKFKPASTYIAGMSFLIVFVGIPAVLVVVYPQVLIFYIDYQTTLSLAMGGVLLQLIVFALGVGQKINLLKHQHARALEAKLEAEKESNEKLLQADKLKDEFLANTSHELRTPLNGILGLSEAVHDGVTGPTTREMRENLSMVISSARRLSGLVNDLLDFSRLKNFDLDLQLRAIDFRSLADVVMKVSQSILGGKALQLIQDIPDELPPVFADENRLQQILYNLIGNAIKFTDAGTVRLSARAEKQQLLISVQDTGIGIPSDKVETIFQSFEQGDGSTAREYGGTGLGLSITRQLIELHGGKIWVDSTPGEGSNFSFCIPLAEETEEVIRVNSSADPIHSPIPPEALPKESNGPEKSVEQTLAVPFQKGGGRSVYRILVVDDEPINRQVLKNHLAAEPFYVTTVMNGIEALEAIESGKEFDLVLLDVMMPKLSGFEVCQRLREKYLPSELPIIMITAKNQVSDLVSGLTFGANDYIVKPFSKQELLARIQTHLNLLDIHAATSRFVPYEFLKSLGKETITEVKLGDQVAREGTVLFSDIRGYTSLAEGMSPKETFAFLNAYLSRMGPVIQQNRGFVNQFYGDGIMALFLNEGEDALKAGIGMLHTLHDYNQDRLDKDRAPLRIGIGMHHGSLMMGMIGDDRRLDTGLVADTVNTTSRIEGLTKFYGASLLISSSLYNEISDPSSYHFRALGKALVKGRVEPIELYECLDGLETEEFALKMASFRDFDDGLKAYYAKAFSEAKEFFSNVLRQNPQDLAAEYYLDQTSSLIGRQLDDNWTGVNLIG